MLLIQNAHIKTMAGADIPNGCLLVEDGKIAAVAPEIDAPVGAKVIDAQGRLLTPGCVEAHCHIGLDNQAMRWEGMDYNEIVDPLTPQLRAIDSINPQDEAFGLALRGGVTTACTGPGSANVVGGTFAILKLAGKRVDKMVLRSPAAMKCAFGENPKGCYGQGKKQSPMTRMAVAGLLRELLMRTIRYRDDKAAGKNPPLDVKLEAMLPVVNREIPIKCHAHRADDILTAVRIAREFDLKLTLDHCTDGEVIADELAEVAIRSLLARRSAARARSSCGTRALRQRASCTAQDRRPASSPTHRSSRCSICRWRLDLRLRQDCRWKKRGAPLPSIRRRVSAFLTASAVWNRARRPIVFSGRQTR